MLPPSDLTPQHAQTVARAKAWGAAILRIAQYLTLMMAWVAPAAAQIHGASGTARPAGRTSVVRVSYSEPPSQAVQNLSLQVDLQRSGLDSAREPRLSVAVQKASSRSPLLFPTIGLFAGAIVGYLVGRSDEPDVMIPGYSLPFLLERPPDS